MDHDSLNSQAFKHLPMHDITGKVKDYGLDLPANPETLNHKSNLGRMSYDQDEVGLTVLSMMSVSQANQKYPAFNARTNLFTLIKEELSNERNILYTQEIIPKMEVSEYGLQDISSNQKRIPYLNRFLLYLIDRMVQGNHSCSQIIISSNFPKPTKKPTTGHLPDFEPSQDPDLQHSTKILMDMVPP